MSNNYKKLKKSTVENTQRTYREQQINTESIIIDILNGLQQVITEQERLNVAKMVLYMHLSKVQMFEEETSLSVDRDNTSEWVRSYLVSMAVRGCTKASVEAYRHEYKVFFPWINKDIKLITTNDIRGYLAYCKISRKNKDITINAKIRMLRGLFLWLYEEEYIEKNPMMKIKENKVENRVKEVFKDEEVTILKDVCIKKHIRDITIVNFLHSTGVRVSEMVGLDIRDIDIAGRECIVYGKEEKRTVEIQFSFVLVHSNITLYHCTFHVAICERRYSVY